MSEMKSIRSLLGIVLIALLLGCGSDEDPMIDERDINRLVIEQMLELAEMNSIKRLELNWDMVAETVLLTYDSRGFNSAVLQLLGELGDNHSFYRSANNQGISNSQIRCNSTFDLPNMESDSIGYIRVEAFSGSSEEGIGFAQSIQNEIKRQDGRGIKGWVVDLSNNAGGNMYPMITGLGPLLGDAIHGYFIDPTGVETSWGFDTNGAFVSAPNVKPFSLPDSYTLLSPRPKIAVVIDNLTASSGEATLISFLGIPNTLFIGQPSCGLSTANAGYDLINEGRFFITVSTMADRNKMLFGDMIPPDIESRDIVEIQDEILKFLNN